LTKLMDIAEGRCRRDTVTREKAWWRDGEDYRKLSLPSTINNNDNNY
jgi:hypothetical protein